MASVSCTAAPALVASRAAPLRAARFGSVAPLRPAVAGHRSAPATSRALSVSVNASVSVAAAEPRFARVVPQTLPRVYVYDHCPFCVRVRLALGYKNVKHEVVFMANDDKETPMNLVGKKVAPILELKDQGFVMMESLDIIEKIDNDPKYGPTGVIAPKSDRTDIKAWMKSVQSLLRLLHRPRYMMAALPEFQQKDSRDFFVWGHQLPPYEKADWKENLTMDQKWKLYEEALASTPDLMRELNAKLAELDGLIYSADYCTESTGGFSYDDVDLWARLRSITLVKGAEFGPKTRAYLDNLSAVCDIPTYECMSM